MSLTQFRERYGTQRQCEAALEQARWPQGFRCPSCGAEQASSYRKRGLRIWQCSACWHQSSLLAGTVFESTKLPLSTWFLAMFLISQAKNNLSALSLMRQLGVSYPSAWLIKHKLMDVMAECEQTRRLSGRVQIDDAYLGGERPGRRGTPPEHKFAFVAAVQTTDQGHPLYVRFDALGSVNQDLIGTWGARSLSPGAIAISDGHGAYLALAPLVAAHQAFVVGTGKAAAQHPSFRWVNTLIGNFKRACAGTYHAFKFAKYAQRYLAEYAYRFNRRFDLRSLTQKLLLACAAAAPRPETQIRRADVAC
jgi:ribosomal protein L37AE/L43A